MKKIFFAGFFFALIPLSICAHVGEQRVVEQKYIVQLSRSPLSPSVDQKTAFLLSFFDIQKDELIIQPLLVDIRLAHLEHIGSEPLFIEEKINLETSGGSLDYSRTFTEPGFYELYASFRFKDDPEKVFTAQDFLFEVSEKRGEDVNLLMNTFFIILGIILGMIGMRALSQNSQK